MEATCYLDKFQTLLTQFDMELFGEKELTVKIGIWQNSVVLKIQKKAWTNTTLQPARQAIFFSIWISDELMKANRMSYNIHALKLRELKNYNIKSREFAAAFRTRFKPHEQHWPNVSTAFGPLTLMEGWVNIENDNLESLIKELVDKFLDIQHLIDELLAERRKV